MAAARDRRPAQRRGLDGVERGLLRVLLRPLALAPLGLFGLGQVPLELLGLLERALVLEVWQFAGVEAGPEGLDIGAAGCVGGIKGCLLFSFLSPDGSTGEHDEAGISSEEES